MKGYLAIPNGSLNIHLELMVKIKLGYLNPKSKKIDKQTVLEFCNAEN